MKRRIISVLTAVSIPLTLTLPLTSSASFASGNSTDTFEISSHIEEAFARTHEKLTVDESLFDKFLKYSLLVTDKDSLSAEELELCRKIFETERTYMPYITCPNAREYIKSGTLFPRVSTDDKKLLACMAPNDVGSPPEIYNYSPDIKYDPFDYNYSEILEFWCNDSGMERIISDYDLNMGPAYEVKFNEMPGWDKLDELTELCWAGGDLSECDGAYTYSGRIDSRRFKDLLHYETMTSDIWTYQLLDDSTAFIVDCTLPKYGNAERIEEPLVLPRELDGHPVSGITRALSGTGVSKLVIPDNYKNVRYLIDMNYLEKVEVDAPDLTLESCLSNCPELKTAVLNVKSIEKNTFYRCGSLTSVDIKSAEGIGCDAFAGLTSLSEVKLPENLVYIGQDAFANTSVTELVIPKSVKIVGALKNPYIENGKVIDPLTADTIRIADEDCVIKSYYDSEAHHFAIANGCEFSPLDDMEYGDVNGDGSFNIADVVVFQKWLLNSPDARIADWRAADLCADGRLDVFDLCLMKKLVLNPNG